MSNIEDHLTDIDFRTWQARHDSSLEDFINWYNELRAYTERHDINERIEGQLTMLSSVLWYLMPPADYKKLMKLSKQAQLA